MRLLLDTHILLWWLADDETLPSAARVAIENPASEIFISAATVWEVAIKHALGRLQFPVARITETVERSAFTQLAVTFEHAVIAGALPRHHGDPFDRMLVAQAQHEGLTIVTVDPAMRLYAVALLGPQPP